MKTLLVLILIFYITLFEQIHGRCRPGFKPKKPTFIESKSHSTPSNGGNNGLDEPVTISTTTTITTLPSETSTEASTNITRRVSFNPNRDAKMLHEALNGSAVNTSKVIQVLTSKKRGQRLEIAKQYEEMYQMSLIRDVSKKLSGNFKKLTKALLTPLTEYYARELFTAVNGPGTDEHCLIDILTILDNQEMEAVKAKYEKMFGETLEFVIREDTSGDFKDLLISLIKAKRESGYSKHQAVTDAGKLLQAGKLQLGTDEAVFIEILTTRSYEQLRQTFDEYELIAGHTMEYIIDCEFSYDIKEGLLAIVSAVRNLSNYFAERLHSSMVGPGTRSTQLTRIMAMIDSSEMPKIKIYYRKNYGISLWDAVEDDTSGNYKDCLLALVKKTYF